MTVGADKGYDTQDFVAAVRALRVTPHITQSNTKPAQRSRWTDDTAYGVNISLSKRWLVEKPFGWLKQIGDYGK